MTTDPKTGRSRLSAPADFTTKRRRLETALSARSGWVRRRPQAARGFEWLKPVLRPPLPFLGCTVQFTMMRPTERHRKFIADLLTEPARLRKTQMVRVTGFAAADEAGLPRDKAQVLLVP